MDGRSASAERGIPAPASKRWTRHASHDVGGPHLEPLRIADGTRGGGDLADQGRLITLDGARGEGGGQILRSALTLSLLTGRPFRIVKIRANRDNPGLRPQHLKAVEAAAALGQAEVKGAAVGSRDLAFRPGAYEPRDLEIEIGTAGATTLVLQTLHLPLALRADRPIRVALTGGTFNTAAPSYPFLATTWRNYLALLGMPIALTMPAAGFFPRGGGQVEAWIEPATPRSLIRTQRGPLTRITGVAGVSNLRFNDVAGRMRDRALGRLADLGFEAEIELADWPGPGTGAAIALTAEHDGIASTFVGLGARGKRAEAVADEAVNELLDYEDAQGAVDLHAADQVLLPLAFAEGRSEYTVAEVTEHLRTNAETIRAFHDRPIRIEEPDDDRPGRVIVG
jgi:RNA 3'-terminal phosphate cyclase (ATP)